ncbi:MAG: hypothetical protein PVF15_06730 [Candidatus Bathyarchaeota archaeon]
MRTWQFVLFALGVLGCLIAAYLMGWGESILGENYIGIATVMLIAGLGIITVFAATSVLGKPDES